MMRNKGVMWGVLIIISLITVITFALIGYFAFGENIAFRKRAIEEEILNIGNEMETDARLVQQAATLTLWQTMHDVGRNYILNQDDVFYYDADNHPGLFVDYTHRIDLLPYWDSIPNETIIAGVERASTNLFSNYLRNLTDFYKELNRNPANTFIRAERNVETCVDAKVINFTPTHITVDFANVTFKYSSNRVKLIEAEVPVKVELRTDFNQTMKAAQEAIDRLKELLSTKSEIILTIRNGEAFDISTSTKTQPTDPDYPPDMKFEIIPASSENFVCCQSTTGSDRWVSGSSCGTDITVPIVNCEPGSSSSSSACDAKCSGEYDATTNSCTCKYPLAKKITFLDTAAGKHGSDCKDSEASFSNSITVNDGDTFCLRTKEFDVKPSCTTEVDAPTQEFCKVLNSQDSACELHTATMTVASSDDTSISLLGNYEINTIIQYDDAESVQHEIADKYGFGVDVDACNGFNHVLVMEDDSKQVPLFIYGEIRPDNIGLQFVVDTSIDGWTVNPPKAKLDDVIVCPLGGKTEYFAECARTVYVDADFPVRSDSPVFKEMYGPVRKFVC